MVTVTPETQPRSTADATLVEEDTLRALIAAAHAMRAAPDHTSPLGTYTRFLERIRQQAKDAVIELGEHTHPPEFYEREPEDWVIALRAEDYLISAGVIEADSKQSLDPADALERLNRLLLDLGRYVYRREHDREILAEAAPSAKAFVPGGAVTWRRRIAYLGVMLTAWEQAATVWVADSWKPGFAMQLPLAVLAAKSAGVSDAHIEEAIEFGLRQGQKDRQESPIEAATDVPGDTGRQADRVTERFRARARREAAQVRRR